MWVGTHRSDIAYSAIAREPASGKVANRKSRVFRAPIVLYVEESLGKYPCTHDINKTRSCCSFGVPTVTATSRPYATALNRCSRNLRRVKGVKKEGG